MYIVWTEYDHWAHMTHSSVRRALEITSVRGVHKRKSYTPIKDVIILKSIFY